MASLTIRKLDDAIKAGLRMRAASNGRSVEDEVRVILREAATPAAPTVTTASNVPRKATIPRARNLRCNSNGLLRVTLIIGGGIAAYKALDLIRRLKERGFIVRCIMTNAAQQFVTPLSAGTLRMSVAILTCSISGANSTQGISGSPATATSSW